MFVKASRLCAEQNLINNAVHFRSNGLLRWPAAGRCWSNNQPKQLPNNCVYLFEETRVSGQDVGHMMVVQLQRLAGKKLASSRCIGEVFQSQPPSGNKLFTISRNVPSRSHHEEVWLHSKAAGLVVCGERGQRAKSRLLQGAEVNRLAAISNHQWGMELEQPE